MALLASVFTGRLAQREAAGAALSWARMPFLGQVHAHGLPSKRVQLVYVQRLHPLGMRL